MVEMEPAVEFVRDDKGVVDALSFGSQMRLEKIGS